MKGIGDSIKKLKDGKFSMDDAKHPTFGQGPNTNRVVAFNMCGQNLKNGRTWSLSRDTRIEGCLQQQGLAYQSDKNH